MDLDGCFSRMLASGFPKTQKTKITNDKHDFSLNYDMLNARKTKRRGQQKNRERRLTKLPGSEVRWSLKILSLSCLQNAGAQRHPAASKNMCAWFTWCGRWQPQIQQRRVSAMRNALPTNARGDFSIYCASFDVVHVCHAVNISSMFSCDTRTKRPPQTYERLICSLFFECVYHFLFPCLYLFEIFEFIQERLFVMFQRLVDFLTAHPNRFIRR